MYIICHNKNSNEPSILLAHLIKMYSFNYFSKNKMISSVIQYIIETKDNNFSFIFAFHTLKLIRIEAP